jgi:predicted Zn-dependent protease
VAATPRAGASFDEVARKAAIAREANRLDQAIPLYHEALGLRPKWDEGWWYFATMLYDTDRFPEARDAFARFVALKPNADSGWVLRGLCDFRVGDYPGALEHLDRGLRSAVGLSPDLRRVARYHQGLLLVRAGQFELAAEPVSELTRSQAESESLIDLIGLMQLRKARFPDDIKDAERDLVRRAGRAGYIHLGRKGQDAGPAFADLVAAYPNEPQVHYAYGLFLLAREPDQALLELRRETEIAPDNVYAHLDVAFELLRRNDASGARESAEKAVGLAPNLFAAHNALGRALVELGQVDQGIAELQTAAGLAPDSPEMYFALARAYARAGRKEEAERARETFAELDRKRQERRGRAPGPVASTPRGAQP